MPKQMETEVNIAKEANAMEAGIMEWGEPSIYACAECRGAALATEGREQSPHPLPHGACLFVEIAVG